MSLVSRRLSRREIDFKAVIPEDVETQGYRVYTSQFVDKRGVKV
ncbi:MAG: hypothetical protein AAFV71_24165 [Cyanobacteria bacterium J06633_8]